MRRYQLTVTEEQAAVINRALEFYERVGGMGQFDVVTEPWIIRGPVGNIQAAREALDEAKLLLTGMPYGNSYGIMSPQVPEEFRRVYDLHQVIRHRLAWDKNPKGDWTYPYDKPNRLGDQPLATITEIKEENQ